MKIEANFDCIFIHLRNFAATLLQLFTYVNICTKRWLADSTNSKHLEREKKGNGCYLSIETTIPGFLKNWMAS